MEYRVKNKLIKMFGNLGERRINNSMNFLEDFKKFESKKGGICKVEKMNDEDLSKLIAALMLFPVDVYKKLSNEDIIFLFENLEDVCESLGEIVISDEDGELDCTIIRDDNNMFYYITREDDFKTAVFYEYDL